MVEPIGVPKSIAVNNPKTAHTTDTTALQTVTDKKLLKTRIADNAGKITKAEISKEPTRFIARTIITAVITATIALYVFTFVPVALAKFWSKVIAKILL